MTSGYLKREGDLAYLSGGSMAYVDGLYEDYLADPNSVSEDWKAVFSKLPQVNGQAGEISHRDIQAYFLQQGQRRAPQATVVSDPKQAEVANLINAYRTFGHHLARLDPLEMAAQASAPSLDLAYHHLTEQDFNQSFFVDGLFGKEKMSLRDLYQALKDTYCGSIGIEYKHISHSDEVEWLQNKMESVRGRLDCSVVQKKQILKDLIAADGLERYLGTRFVGQKRFSLEGGDALVPMMNEIIRLAGASQVNDIVVGMAHRGRLNVLVNVLGKEPDALFQEFEGKVSNERTGDVKYHMGYSSDLKTESGNVVHMVLAFNPSHLEIIGPVVEGSCRSRMGRRHDLESKNKVVPVVIHGDAAFAGQGVVMETFNFSQARGYCTGGTVHIVVNNQIGFTTSNPLDARSTFYCTDVAKMVQAPVIHVNGDDPEAVLFATQIAFEYRMRFKRDVVVDLVCYRRHGHNEADEPSLTQPIMYRKIKTMRPLREKYAETLVSQNLITLAEVDSMVEGYRNKLDKGESVVDVYRGEYPGKISNDWGPYLHSKWDEEVDTAVSQKTLTALSATLQAVPDGAVLHPAINRLLAERAKMTTGELQMNWGYAETMAYATLLQEGTSIRLSGQDCGRGTFTHRHAVLHDAEQDKAYIPLERVAHEAGKVFQVIDSVLSEEAVLAFEYGFAASEPGMLVLWEAQFGDFANGAQVVIDQFISSGEQKWGRLCGLVMLLPHGYEGQGPEHSSARLERFMQLCAQQNIQVCTPTTPAQIFHLLRRQVLRHYRKPLIVMTPKSLLRHKLAVSSLSDLTKGRFQNVIPEMDVLDPKKVTRVILCCGKVYYDLLQKRRDEAMKHIAIIRIEQLYPFPEKALMAELVKYAQAKQIIWCQEEPKNQGVWYSSQHHIRDCLQKGQELFFAGRPSAAAPAVGSLSLHTQQQQALVDQALTETFN